ncbi:DUF4350 domain-containing protein [Roseibacillus ishigakijimensis]|nr:DUF4350 domain-containing protein [Roseibacillus ishigakijimensis]
MAVLLAACGRFEEKEREVGYQGLAKINHFLAAQRLAEEMGLAAGSYAGAPALPPPTGTTLVVSAASLQSEGQLWEISQWMDEGGHLVVYMVLQNKDWLWYESSDFDDYFAPFLNYFQLALEFPGGDEKAKKVSALAPFGLGTYATEFETPFLIDDLEDYEAPAESIRSFDYGGGSLTVMATAEPFTNRHLGKGEHATLLWDLLTLEEGDAVWFVYSTRLSFFRLLWEKASAAVVAFLLLLIFFVWWAARGFGPRFHRLEVSTAKLDEHLQASGAFFRKHRAEDAVLAPLRERLLHRLAKATNLPFNTPASELVAVARERALLGPDDEVALLTPVTAKGLLERLQHLSQLDKKL